MNGPDIVCQVCSAPLVPWQAEVTDSLTAEVFTIARCSRCGLGHTLPAPEDLAPYYPATYHGGRHGLTAAWCARRRLGWVTEECGPGSGRRLLDVGCGDGTFLLAAQRQGWQVAGVELNPVVARQAGLVVHEEVTQTDGYYDCITLWHSLEHLPDPAGVLDQLAEKLKPDGALIVAVPNADSLQAQVFGRHWLHLDVPRHLFHFDPHSLATLLEQVGLEVSRTIYQELEYDLMGWLQSSQNAFFPVPNILFSLLTGRATTATSLSALASMLAGVATAPVALLLVMLEAALRRSGTVVLVARPSI